MSWSIRVSSDEKEKLLELEGNENELSVEELCTSYLSILGQERYNIILMAASCKGQVEVIVENEVA